MANNDLKITISAQDNASKAFEALAKAAESAAASLEDAEKSGSKGFEQAAKGAEKAAGSMAKISDAGDGVIRTFDGVEESIVKLGAGLSTVGNTLDQLGGKYLEQQRQITALNYLYGDASSEFQRFADQIQNTTLFSDDQARQAESYFATLRTNYGVTEDQIKRLISVSADLAQIHGTSLEDASLRIQAAIRGEAESVEALGLSMGAQAIDRDNLMMSMSNQEAAQFRLNALWEQTANVQGAATDATGSLVGQYRQLTNEVQDVAQTVGQFVGPIGQVFSSLGEGVTTVGETVRGFKDIKSGITGLIGAAASMGPVGLAITGVTAALGVAGYAFLKSREDAAAARAEWEAAGAAIDDLNQKAMELALSGQTGAAGWAGQIANDTNAFFDTFNTNVDQFIDDLSHNKAVDELSDTGKMWADAFWESLTDQQQADILAKQLVDGTGLNEAMKAWAEDSLKDPELQQAIGTELSDLFSLSSNSYVDQDKLRSETSRIIADMISSNDVPKAKAELEALYTSLAEGAGKAQKAMQDLKRDFTLDDLRAQGKFDIADDLERSTALLDQMAAGWQQVTVAQETWASLPASDQAAVWDQNAAAMSMSVELSDQYAEAQDRINEKVASGSLNNGQLLDDLAAINQQRVVNIASGMDEAEANEAAARAVIALSENTAQYTTQLTAAQQAQIAFASSTNQMLTSLQAFGGGYASGTAITADQLGVSLDKTAKSLDQVLAIYDQIESLSSRSSSASSIAETLIGNADEIGALPSLMDEIAAGTSRATLSQQEYVEAMGAGNAIVASNAQVQGLLTSIQAQQLPYLAAQQTAYENNIASLEQMSAEEQRRVLLLQDSTVQQGLATAAEIQATAATSGMTQAMADQLATQALLNPQLSDALEMYGALRVTSDGYYQVLGANGQWITTTITAQTDAVTANTEAVGESADSWASWAEEAAAAGLTSDQLKENLTGLRDTLTEISDVDPSLLGVNMLGLGTDITGFAADVQQGAAALDNAFRVVVSNTEGIKSQFQGLFDWADDLIAEEGTWSRLDELLDKGLISGEHGVFTGDSQYAAAQQAYNVIAEVNESVADSIDAIQANLSPVLADLAQQQAAYIDTLRGMPAEQQLAALGWMDSAESARAYELATLAADAAAGKFGETGMTMATQAIAAAAAADPVLATMLEQMGLISIGADGTITVDYSSVENASGTIDGLNDSLKILTLLMLGVPPAVIKAEVDGKGDVDDLYETLLGMPENQNVGVQVETEGTGVEDLKQVTLADGTVVTVKADVDTTGWDESTVGDIINNGKSAEVQTVLEPPTGWSVDDWNNSEGPLPTIEVPTEAAPVTDAPAYEGTPVSVPITFDYAADETYRDPSGIDGPFTAPVTTSAPSITITADDQASAVLTTVQAAADALDGQTSTVDLAADDQASTPLSIAYNNFTLMNGQVSTLGLALDDQASGPLSIAFNNFVLMDGQVSTLNLDADTSDAENAIAWAQAYDGSILATSYIDIVTRQTTVTGTRSAYANGGTIGRTRTEAHSRRTCRSGRGRLGPNSRRSPTVARPTSRSRGCTRLRRARRSRLRTPRSCARGAGRNPPSTSP